MRPEGSEILARSAARRMLVPLLFLAFALTYFANTDHLSLRAVAFPYLCVGVVSIIAGGIIVAQIRGLWQEMQQAASTGPPSTSAGWLAETRQSLGLVGGTLAALVGYVWLIIAIGFYAATAVFVLVMVAMLGGYRPWYALIAAPVVAVGTSYLLFEVALALRLP